MIESTPISVLTQIISGQTKLAEQMKTVAKLTTVAIEANLENLKLIVQLKERIEQLEQKVNQ
jgi:hypothetical protein